MKFAIVGAGAIGGLLGAKLARAGHEVHLIARGKHLAAIREKGLRLRSPSGEFTVFPRATEDPAEIGAADVVIISLKAHSLPEIAPRLTPLLGPETPVVTAMNGLPWWYFQRHGGPFEGTLLKTLDPDGAISEAIPARRVIGCIVLPAAEIESPGVIRHVEGLTFPIGEPDGGPSARARRFAEAMTGAGFKCPISENIRHDIWVKLMGNVAFNPISALTQATLVDMAAHREVRGLATAVMKEVETVCDRLDLPLSVSVERRLEGARRVGAHKTSMLQDLEANRPLELECMVGAVLELAGILESPMPHTRALYGMTKLLSQVRSRAEVAPSAAG